MPTKVARSLLCLVIQCALSLRAEARDTDRWETYRNERFGFSLNYPANIFGVERTTEAGDGRIFSARELDAKLLVGAFPNTNGYSLATYRAVLERQSYGAFKVTYQRLGGRWLVISGEDGTNTFYEKVIFSCGGRVISSFATIYPTAQQHIFGPIVERVEDSFRAGSACELVGVKPGTDVGKQRLVRRPVGVRSTLADRIARQRGTDVIVVMRRRGPPHDYKVVRGFVSR